MHAVVEQNRGTPETAARPLPAQAHDERDRPHYHFTPESGWMNDPNGLYWHDGVYHLFFQYQPDDSQWGPMHWGHATSPDLVRWRQQSIALFPQGAHTIFSGSAVVDAGNSSGFGDGRSAPVVAIFTLHDSANAHSGRVDVETQGLAWSLDNGHTWTHYKQNPVLENPGIRDFRDPKVTWDPQRRHWLMSLAAHDRICFYASKNLKEWTFVSEFGARIGAHGGVWECPDLFQIAIAGSAEKKWVLLVSLTLGGPNGGSATQYFVGDFDGVSFTLDARFAQQLARDGAAWLDWGRDNYAGVLFNHAPGCAPLMIGWMSNWQYAGKTPTTRWRGTSTIARELALADNGHEWLLKSRPVPTLQSFYHPDRHISRQQKIGDETLLVSENEIDLSKAVIHLTLSEADTGVHTFTLRNRLGERLLFGIDGARRVLFTDRRHSGRTGFSEYFADTVSTAPLPASMDLAETRFEIVLDKTSIELFLNDGERVMSHLVFPSTAYCELSLSSSIHTGTCRVCAHELLLE